MARPPTFGQRRRHDKSEGDRRCVTRQSVQAIGEIHRVGGTHYGQHREWNDQPTKTDSSSHARYEHEIDAHAEVRIAEHERGHQADDAKQDELRTSAQSAAPAANQDRRSS